VSDKQKAALTGLVIALIVGAMAQAVVKHEAAVLGLSALELAMVGLVVGSVATRTLAR
jgi:hypothetical protein